MERSRVLQRSLGSSLVVDTRESFVGWHRKLPFSTKDEPGQNVTGTGLPESSLEPSYKDRQPTGTLQVIDDPGQGPRTLRRRPRPTKFFLPVVTRPPQIKNREALNKSGKYVRLDPIPLRKRSFPSTPTGPTPTGPQSRTEYVILHGPLETFRRKTRFPDVPRERNPRTLWGHVPGTTEY